MKTSLAVIAAAALALSACSGSEPAPTKTVTQTSAPKATKADIGKPKPANNPWDDVKTYDDAYSLIEAAGVEHFAMTSDESMYAMHCDKADQTTVKQRDEVTGALADVTNMMCERAETGETVDIYVNGDWTEDGPQVPMCEVYDDVCFQGKGWTVSAENEFVMAEVLTELGINAKGMGFNE